MSFEAILFGTSGIALSLLGAISLFLAWKSPTRVPVLLATGWLLLCFASALWIYLLGVEFGLAYALLIPSLGAGVVLLLNINIKSTYPPSTNRIVFELPTVRPRDFLRHFSTLLLTVPVSALVAFAVSARVCTWVFDGTTNQIAAMIFMVPVVWAIAASWVTTDSKVLRPIITLLSLTALSLATLYGG